jgi:hypothetical protein
MYCQNPHPVCEIWIAMAVKFSFELGFGYSFITFTNQQNYLVYHAKDKIHNKDWMRASTLPN